MKFMQALTAFGLGLGSGAAANYGKWAHDQRRVNPKATPKFTDWMHQTALGSLLRSDAEKPTTPDAAPATPAVSALPQVDPNKGDTVESSALLPQDTNPDAAQASPVAAPAQPEESPDASSDMNPQSQYENAWNNDYPENAP